MVQFYIKTALAPSTRRTYGTGERRYLQFCVAGAIAPLPTSESILCRYVAFLAKDNLKHQTIKTYLSAVRHMHIVAGKGDPFKEDMPLLEYTMRGIKSDQARNGESVSRTRLPITPAILLQLRKVWERDASNPTHIMLWAAVCTCFFGFLRSGEICVPSAKDYDPGAHLSFGDVRLDSTVDPHVAQVNIKASKTDPFRKGVSLFLGRTGSVLCPVLALAAYLASRGPQLGPFFMIEGRPLTREVFVSKVREALSEAGLDPLKFAGHSFRIGAASTAASRGVEDSLIKTLGRWRSSAYLLYVRIPREWLAGLSTVLADKHVE